MRSPRLDGHTIEINGAPHASDGSRIVLARGAHATGRGKCSCLAMSSVLETGAARRSWHRTHKAALILAGPTLDLMMPAVSYMVGMFQTDGSHGGSIEGKGNLTLEVAVRDAELLPLMAGFLPCHAQIRRRTRVTNFSAERQYETAILTVCAQPVRRFFQESGVLVGKKSADVAPPVGDFLAADYVRGLIDGDGSVGITATGRPFISFVTASEPLARYLASVIHDVCGVDRNPGRNARDGVFNLMVASQPACDLAAWLYYDGCLALSRKKVAAALLAEWTPPSTRYGARMKRWNPADDAVVRSMSLEAAALQLGRTEASISMRRWRLSVNPRRTAAVAA